MIKDNFSCENEASSAAGKTGASGASDGKKREFDESQKAAINADKNSVVSAGAGSGKTTVLSERYCRLVIERKLKPEEILTLTFTKKATVEMSSRIYKVLKEKAPEVAKEFYKANIKTLDSYCASVAKMGAHFYGVTPEFVQDKDALSKKASELSLSYLMKNRNNPVLKELVGTKDFVTAANEIFSYPVTENSSISEPIDFDEALKKQREEIIRVWNKTTKEFSSCANSFVNELNTTFAKKSGATLEKYRAAFENGVPSIPALTEEMIVSGNYVEITDFLNKIEPMLTVRKPGAMRDSELLSELCDAFREQNTDFRSVKAYLVTFPSLKALVPLLKEYQEELNIFKRSSGFLSFKDISSLAFCTLRDYPEIRKLEKQKYKAIMIDEFQDNNSLQRDMLFMLAEKEDRMEKSVPEVQDLCPDKLFFVGDEKQSIYLFRGADVSVFRALSSDFKDGNLRMDTNYRSDKALIACFNTIFGGEAYPTCGSPAVSALETIPVSDAASGAENPQAPGGKESSSGAASSGESSSEVPSAFYVAANTPDSSPEGKQFDSSGNEIPPYEAVYNHVEIPSKMKEEVQKASNPEELYSPHMHFALFDSENAVESSEYLSGEEAEADWIARKIKSLVTEGVNGKVYKYSDIAVLLRNYSTQSDFERSFLNHSIPYNTETVKGFFNDGPVNDIFSYLRLLVYPEDSLSYMQVLCSPFVNLRVEEAQAVLLLKDGLFELSKPEILSAESYSRFKNASSFFYALKEKVKTLEIPEIITELWYNAGYRYEVLWNQSVGMYEKMYDLLFALALKAKNNGETLASFVDNSRIYMEESSKVEDMDIPMEKVSGVNILSIHKSKGLEYPVVFVSSAHKKGVNDTNSAPVYYDSEFGLSVNFGSDDNYFYNRTKELRKSKASAELRRVVYVALTRAVNELYVTCGKFDKGSLQKAFDYVPGGAGDVSTVFSVLAPFYAHFTSENYTGIKPFDVEEILPVKRAFVSEGKKRKNTGAEKAKLFKELSEAGHYEKAEVVEKEEVLSKYITPSALHGEFNGGVQEEGISPKVQSGSWSNSKGGDTSASGVSPSGKAASGVPFPSVNEIIEKSGNAFDYSDFGTLAHSYMEAAVNGNPFVFPEALASLLKDKKDSEVLLRDLEQMKNAFFETEAGKAVLEAREKRWFRTETPFKSCIAGKIVNGVMDLVFKNSDGTYTILDYKTDQGMDCTIYYNQLACYKKSLCEMLDIREASSVKCLIHFLRYGKTFDITEECEKVDLEKVLNNFEA